MTAVSAPSAGRRRAALARAAYQAVAEPQRLAAQRRRGGLAVSKAQRRLMGRLGRLAQQTGHVRWLGRAGVDVTERLAALRAQERAIRAALAAVTAAVRAARAERAREESG